jgi:hypothetical protein
MQQPRVVQQIRPQIGPGIPIEITENDYDGSANSSEFAPAFNTNDDSWYADFKVAGNIKFYRMYGKSSDEVTNYIRAYKRQMDRK